MIIKSYETDKLNLTNYPYVLLNGKNEGLKNAIKTKLLKNLEITSSYDEKDILENKDHFIENIYSGSLFETKKVLNIKRVSDKILNILVEIFEKNLNDITIIVEADNLEKKSKLRSFFEKGKDYVCVPIYPDNEQTLSKVAFAFLRDKKISISPSDLNSIISKTNGDRKILFSELNKLENYSKYGKKINSETVARLTNILENHDISELINHCLANNKRKTIAILIENNFGNEDCILIIRTFLNKLKKILKLSDEFEKNKNIELTISTAKPAIFWKEKEITKQQILRLKPKDIKKIIYKLSEVELNIKKNYENSVNLLTDFIVSQIAIDANNKI